MKKLFQITAFGAFAVLSTSTAFCAAQVDPGTPVPDGGATVGLLALAMAGLVGFARRRAK